MATTATVDVTLSYSDADTSSELTKAITSTLSNRGFTADIQSIGTSEEAITLGETTSPGYMLIINLDATNYVELKTGSSGTIFAKLDANGGCALLKLGSGAQTPYAIANSAACLVRKLIVRT